VRPNFPLHFSLLGEGYKLDQLLRAAEETDKIRASRRANMKGSKWEKFKKAIETSVWLGARVTPKEQDKVMPKIVVGKSA